MQNYLFFKLRITEIRSRLLPLFDIRKGDIGCLPKRQGQKQQYFACLVASKPIQAAHSFTLLMNSM